MHCALAYGARVVYDKKVSQNVPGQSMCGFSGLAAPDQPRRGTGGRAAAVSAFQEGTI